MKARSSHWTAATLAALCCSTAAAQGNLWIVDDDPGPDVDFAGIQAAVDAASDGDVVLVRPGEYAGFGAYERTLAIVGTGPELPRITSASVVQSVPAGGWFVLEGLELEISGGFDATLRIRHCAGDVRVEGCSVRSFVGPVRVFDSSSVDFTRCTVGGQIPVGFPIGAHGIDVNASSVSIQGCSITGNSSAAGGQHGPSGLNVLNASFVYVAESTLEGGPGGPGGIPGIAQCNIVPGQGGDALTLGTGDPTVVLRDVTLVPGPGGESAQPVCPWGTNGTTLSVTSGSVTTLEGTARGFEATTPVLAGAEDATLAFRGEPGDLAISLATTNPTFLYLPPYGAVLLVDPLAFPAFVGVVPESGLLEVVLPVDPLPPGWESGVLFLQGVAFDEALAGHVGSGALLVMTSSS